MGMLAVPIVYASRQAKRWREWVSDDLPRYRRYGSTVERVSLWDVNHMVNAWKRADRLNDSLSRLHLVSIRSEHATLPASDHKPNGP